MAILMGGTFVSSIVSDEVYDPVFDTTVDANFIYQLLPSFYRTVMQDQDLFATVWSGAMQGSFADLLNLWQVDYAKSLRDVPVLAQRRWVKFDLYKSEDFTTDPGLSSVGVQTVSYNEADQRIEGTVVNRNRWDKGYFPLLATVNERTSLAWSTEITLSAVEAYSGVLFGYYTSESQRISDTLAVAILGSTTGDDEPVAAILHFDPSGVVTVSIDSFVLTMDVSYRLDAEYTAGTGAVVLSVIELRNEKLTSPTGYTLDELSSTTTNVFRDDSVNFDTSGIVEGDILSVFGTEYEILSVDGSTLTVNPIGLPVDVTSTTYSVLGEVEVTSLSMDLPGDAADPTFTADQYGVSSLDRRGISALLFSPTAAAKRKSLTFLSDNWNYLDPTVEETILSLPRLQERVTDPQALLFEGTDYSVEVNDYVPGSVPASVIRFQEPPLDVLWAEYVAYDEQYIRNNFGLNVGLDDVSTDQYKSRVRGLYYAYFQGPTVEATRIGVHILVGLPIAEEAGVVESINPTFSGTLGLLTVSGTDYLYPLAVGTDLQIGDSVEQFQPLSLGVEVVDYLINPEWFVHTVQVAELQKFHTFQVRLNLDAFDVETLTLAGVFVDQIKPTWKRGVFQVFKNLSDEVDMTDDLIVAFTLKLYDTICDQVLISYDDAIYEGSETDWRYSQGITDWDATSAAMRATATDLTGYASLTNLAVGAPGTGTLYTTEIGAAGPQTDKFLTVARRTNGTTGVTAAGSNEFYDNTDGAFDGMVPGDRINITGEGDFLVMFMLQNTFASGVGEFTSTTALEDPEATFISDGVQAGDTIVVSAGPNAGSDYVITVVVSETELTVVGATTSGGAETETYTVQRLNQLTLDAPLGADNTGVSWLGTGVYLTWGEVSTVGSDTALVFATAFPFDTGDYFLALLDIAYKQIYYDQYSELCPDEELTFTATLSWGFQETMLTGRATGAAGLSPLVGIGTLYTSEIGAAGPQTDKYLVLPNGAWVEVATVVTDVLLTTTGVLPVSMSSPGAKVFLADEVPTGTFTFTNGLATVACSASQTGVIAAGDFIQVVPTPTLADETTGPVVEVLSIDGPGTTITLTGLYTGTTAAGTKAIRRGPGGIFPLSQDLPDSQTTVVSQDFTAWQSAAGATISSTVTEPVP